ncbi:MAG: hypothetical protein ACRC20_08515 [Segniliparus sp.]|uniref:hypothetical protein n=1 Tax=Segniliparus sp. TaxID=2804064 RepID=UPI003F3AE3D8
MMKTQRWLRGSIAAVLATSAISGCSAWPFNKVFNGILEGGSTVANTSLGISYTIPKGFYQDKYEATTIKSVSLWQSGRGPEHPEKDPMIDMQKVNWPGVADSTAPPVEDAKRLAWVDKEDTLTNIRQLSWDGPNLPGGLYSYESTAPDGRHWSGVVAVVGYPGKRIQIQALNGHGGPAYLPEVHDVAISARALPNR